jgi:hypothetical protein
MAEIKKIAFGLAGLGIGLVLIDKLGDSEIFNAEHAGNSSSQETVSKKGLISKLREVIDKRFLISDQQEINTKLSGQTVDIIPQGLSPGFDYSSVFAESKASQYVNMAPMGFGVTDVKIDAKNPYDFYLSAEDAGYDMSVVGQEAITSRFRPLGEQAPTPTQVSFMSFDRLAEKLSNMGNTSKELQNKEDRFTRAGFSRMGDTKTFSGTYSPDENSDYTSGSTTKSLAAWRTQGIVNRVTDSMIMLIPRDGSAIKELRRV